VFSDVFLKMEKNLLSGRRCGEFAASGLRRIRGIRRWRICSLRIAENSVFNIHGPIPRAFNNRLTAFLTIAAVVEFKNL
jgi:hypothetical protein